MKRFHPVFLLVLVCCAAVVCAAACAHLSTVRDTSGVPLPLEVSAMKAVHINGTVQWIYEAGLEASNPVLLWLDGGPGGSEVAWVRQYLGPLHEHFTIVCWDQRGTARSYSAGSGPEALEAERFVEDVIALSRLLTEKYGIDRIYLAGHSWGSVIGVRALVKEPDLFAAYIGIGQQVNGIENDLVGWRMVRDGALRNGDHAVVSQLDRNGPPPYDDGERYFYLLSRLYRYSPRSAIVNEFDSALMFRASEHRLIDRINLVRGLIRGVKEVYPQIGRLDFEQEVASLEVPVFFAVGRFDFTCVSEITARWVQGLDAPYKELRWFEASGHEPCYTESAAFIKWMTEQVLPRTASRIMRTEGGADDVL